MIKVRKTQDSIEKKMEDFATMKEIEKALKIEGLKISKRTLYDWNAIVRTVTRPDDRMNWYDIEIDKIEKLK